MIPAILIPIVANIGEKIFERLVRDPEVDIKPADRVVVQPAIEQAVKKEVAPVLEHLTNNENWWQSRVTLGSIAAIICGIAGLFGYALDVQQATELIVIAGSIIGPAFALYGRWKARKPIGA